MLTDSCQHNHSVCIFTRTYMYVIFMIFFFFFMLHNILYFIQKTKSGKIFRIYIVHQHSQFSSDDSPLSRVSTSTLIDV